MNKTKIEWADYTWNPITGCTPISVGCKNCYAARIARRFKKDWRPGMFHPDRLSEPLIVREPSIIFMGSMTDMFHPQVLPDHWYHILNVIRIAQRHQFVVLTKRPGAIRAKLGNTRPPSNLRIGVTIESMEENYRFRLLRKNWSGPNLISWEPALGPPPEITPDVGWFIAGPETGPRARPAEREWFVLARNLCWQLRVPYFEKRHWDRTELTDAEKKDRWQWP